MLHGTLIGESLRPGARLQVGDLRVVSVTRQDVSAGKAPGQPAMWTLLQFEAADEGADALAAELSGLLLAEGGWYCDFTVGDEHVVVYAGQVFRYRRTDPAGRDAAVQYGLSVGVPPHQLDWQD